MCVQSVVYTTEVDGPDVLYTQLLYDIIIYDRMWCIMLPGNRYGCRKEPRILLTNMRHTYIFIYHKCPEIVLSLSLSLTRSLTHSLTHCQLIYHRKQKPAVLRIYHGYPDVRVVYVQSYRESDVYTYNNINDTIYANSMYWTPCSPPLPSRLI